MSNGGVILIDDYDCCPGVKKAVDEFFRKKKEPFLLLYNNQALVIKL